MIFGLLVLTLITGCITNASHYGPRPPLQKLTAGMTKTEVLNIMGKPIQDETSNEKNVVVYSWDDPWDGGIGATEEYFVLLVDGNLKQYGVLTNGSRAYFGVWNAIKQAKSLAFPVDTN